MTFPQPYDMANTPTRSECETDSRSAMAATAYDLRSGKNIALRGLLSGASGLH